MTPEQKSLVQESFKLVEPIASQAAELFYARLFELDPSLQALFSGDMKQQGDKLMDMLGTAVRTLDNLDILVPIVQRLGQRHVGYGVKEGHYETVGTALIDTLEKGLGEAFTDEVRAAWVTVYGILSTTMIDATKEAA